MLYDINMPEATNTRPEINHKTPTDRKVSAARRRENMGGDWENWYDINPPEIDSKKINKLNIDLVAFPTRLELMYKQYLPLVINFPK